MGFRKPHTVLSEAAGSYVDGVYEPGLRSAWTVQCSLQPLRAGYDMIQLPEGRHLSDAVRIYCEELLRVTADGENEQPDIVVAGNGYGYELVAVDDNQMNVINHRRYIAVKIFKFTTNEAWINGDLQRP